MFKPAQQLILVKEPASVLTKTAKESAGSAKTRLALALPLFSRKQFLRFGDDTKRRATVLAQLKQTNGQCPQAPHASLAFVHMCFNQFINAVVAINHHATACLFDEIMGKSSAILGARQWASDAISWMYVFGAIHTFTRFLCHPQTRIPFDNIPVFLMACAVLSARLDEGTYVGWPSLALVCEPYNGLFTPHQLRTVCTAILRSLRAELPYLPGITANDDLVNFAFAQLLPEFTRNIGNDMAFRALCDIELGVCETLFVTRDSKETRSSTTTTTKQEARRGMPRSTVELLFCDLETQWKFVRSKRDVVVARKT